MSLLRPGKLSSRDARNLVALVLSQVANASFPLVIAPFLLHTAGASAYATFAIAEAMAMGLLTLTMYSFDLDAIASVVGKDLNSAKVGISQAFSEVLYARLLLFSAAGATLVGVVALVNDALLGVLGGWMLFVLSQVLASAWLYQGIEKNWIPAWFTVAGRLCALVCILLLVRQDTDVATASFMIGGVSLAFSFALILFAGHSLGIRPMPVPAVAVAQRLKRGWTVFLGSASVFLYRDANLLVLGATVGDPVAISIYSLSEKAVKCLQAAARPVNQLFLPKAIAALRGYDRASRGALVLLRGLLRPQLMLVGGGLLLCYLVLLPTLYFFPDWLRANGFDKAVMLVFLMSPAVLLGVANFMLGSVGLNHLAASRYLFATIAGVGLMNLAWCAGLTSAVGVAGGAISFVLSEAVLLVFVLRAYMRSGAGGGAHS